MEEQWQLIQMELQSKILEDKKMEDERIISQADLSQISNSLGLCTMIYGILTIT